MAARKPNATVCGVPVNIGGPIVDYGGQVRLGTGPYGHRRTISKPGAKRLVEAVLGAGTKLPRRGQSIKLCGDQVLEANHYSNEFYVRKQGPGDIAGKPEARRSPIQQATWERNQATIALVKAKRNGLVADDGPKLTRKQLRKIERALKRRR